MKSSGSLFIRGTRAVLPLFLFLFVAAGGGPVKVVVKCTGAGCPCVDTSGTPVGGDKICPLSAGP
jgi:hypothetical protein